MEVTIRPLREEDAYTSVTWRNDPEVFKYTGNTYNHEITIVSELEWIKRVIAKKDDYRCAILVDGVYVGNIYLTDISEKSATYHIFIGNKGYWGKGVARKASELILDYAFTVLGLETIYLKVHKDNNSALSLYRKLGFQGKIFDTRFISMELSNKGIRPLDATIDDVTTDSPMDNSKEIVVKSQLKSQKDNTSGISEYVLEQIDVIAKTSQKTNPLVVINCITYNHESYIRDALEGFVMQKTNFPVVAIVHDDASIDGTAAIIREYAEKYPDIIKPIYETENQYSKRDGSLGRIMQEARNATGAKYVAFCEGDDYWTDPLKLQKQVDYLESHPDCSLCFHNSMMHWEDGRLPDKLMFDIDENVAYTGKDILDNCPFQTASILLRANVLQSELYLNANKASVCGDIIIFLSASSFGYLHGFPEQMSIYRKQSGGVSNTIYRDTTLFYKYMRQHERVPSLFGMQYKKKIAEIVCSRYLSNGLEYIKRKNFKDAVKCFRRSLSLSASQTLVEIGKYLKYKIKKSSALLSAKKS